MDASLRRLTLAASLLTLALTPAANAALPAPVYVIAGGGSDRPVMQQPALATDFSGAGQLAADRYGFVAVTEASSGRVHRVSESSGFNDGRPPEERFVRPLDPVFGEPGGVALDTHELYVADRAAHAIKRKSPVVAGSPTTVAGTGVAGYVDDPSAQGIAQFTAPGPIAAVGATSISSLIVGDAATIRSVTVGSSKTVTRLAGDPGGKTLFFNGDDALSVNLGAYGPLKDVAGIDPAGTLYFVMPVGSGGGSIWMATGSPRKVFALVAGTTVAALHTGMLYGTNRGLVKRTTVGSFALSTPPVTLADVGAPLNDVIVADEGLFFSTDEFVYFMPATAILSGGNGAEEGEVINRDRVNFELGSWDENALFYCDLDFTGLGICADGYQDLDDGQHRFMTIAVTDGGLRRDQTPEATRFFYVDTQAPDAGAPAAPAAGAHTSNAQPVFSWTAGTDPLKDGYASGIASYELRVDGETVATVAGGCDPCSAIPASPLAAGPHTWRVVAIDRGGNRTAGSERTVVIDAPPVAHLTVAPDRALVGRTVTFDAARSSDGGTGITRYEWDLDGQPGYEAESTTPSITRSYEVAGTLTAAVRITNGGGLQSEARAPLTVISTPPPAGGPLGISINNGAQYTNTPRVTLFAAWPSFAVQMFVSNDGGFGKGERFPLTAELAWTLDSSGPERLPKTVYVRYLNGVQQSETYTDDIILDETPPKVLAASAGAAVAGARPAASKRVTLRVRATDNVSGVVSVQVTANRRKPGSELAYRQRLSVKRAPKLFVRARDRAGNRSRWRGVTFTR